VEKNERRECVRAGIHPDYVHPIQDVILGGLKMYLYRSDEQPSAVKVV